MVLTPGDTAGQDEPGHGHGQGPGGRTEGAGSLLHQVHHGYRGHQVQGDTAGEEQGGDDDDQDHVRHQH